MLPKKQGLYSLILSTITVAQASFAVSKERKPMISLEKHSTILVKLEHRGAVSSDGKTGDGAGILIEIPHDFLVKKCLF